MLYVINGSRGLQLIDNQAIKQANKQANRQRGDMQLSTHHASPGMQDLPAMKKQNGPSSLDCLRSAWITATKLIGCFIVCFRPVKMGTAQTVCIAHWIKMYLYLQRCRCLETSAATTGRSNFGLCSLLLHGHAICNWPSMRVWPRLWVGPSFNSRERWSL